MSDGWLFYGFVALICLGGFLNGLRFARMTENPLAGKALFGLPVRGSDLSLEDLRLLGKVMMVGAVGIFVFASALSFGLLGPVEGVQTIGSR